MGLGRRNGQYEVIGQSADLDRLVQWVLQFGVGAEVLAPDALRLRVAEVARRIANLHAAPVSAADADRGRGPHLVDLAL